MDSALRASTFGIPWPEFNEGVKYVDQVSAKEERQTLLDFYCLKYQSSASRTGWIQRIHNRQISVDGVVAIDPSLILRNGAILEYQRLPWREPEAPNELEILFEDDHVLAINKPARLQVLAGGLFQQRTVLQQLQWRDGYNEMSRDGCVLLCAKSPRAKSLLSKDLAISTRTTMERSVKDTSLAVSSERQRRFLKTYRALARGIIASDEMTVDIPIGKVPYPGVAGGLYMASPSGKPSLSKVVVLCRDEANNTTLVQVNILTGRPHQIRIHLAAMGHPLVGDPLYVVGGIAVEGDHTLSSQFHSSPAEDGGFQRIGGGLPGDCGYLLHAWRLECTHPVTRERLVVTARPPPQLQMPTERKSC